MSEASDELHFAATDLARAFRGLMGAISTNQANLAEVFQGDLKSALVRYALSIRNQ